MHENDGTTPDEFDGPFDELAQEPPMFGEARHTVLAPSGQFESSGDFARGLGSRRAKVAIFGIGGILLLAAFAAALQ